MPEMHEIKKQLATMSPEDALRYVSELLDAQGPDAGLLAEKGKLLWRLDRRGDAMSAYRQSAQLQPDGPGAVLLEHSQQIMDFFNPDLLNP